MTPWPRMRLRANGRLADWPAIGVRLATLLLALVPARAAGAAEMIVAPGTLGQVVEIQVTNPSALTWLHGATAGPERIPAFVTALLPATTPMTPGDVPPGATALATFTLDVSPLAAPGALDTLVMRVTTSSLDTMRVAMRVVVGVLGPLASLPYAEDFEGGPGGAIGTGTWERGAPTTGPAHAASGVALWATRLAGDYGDAAADLLYLRPIDLGGAVAPRLSIQHWYQTEFAYDGGVLQVSLDDGATFVHVPPIGGYPALASGTPAFSGRSDPGTAFAPAVFPLAAFAGSTIVARLVLASDASITRPGWYVDDIAVTEGPPVDAAAIALDGPGPVVAAAPGLLLSGRAANLGSAGASFWVRLSADATGHPEGSAATWRDSTFIAALPPGDTIGFSRPLPSAPFASGVPHTVRLRVDAAGDAYAPDDTASAPLVVLAPATLPHHDSFDGPASPHAAGFSPWSRGTPTAGPLAAYHGPGCWGASLAGGYPDDASSSFYVGTFDLTGANQPRLRFYHWYDIEEDFDGARVSVSSDNAAWTVVRPAGGYRAPVVALQGDSAWTGASGTWEVVEVDLSPWVGQARVLVRLALDSDGSGSGQGWFVDSLSVEDLAPLGAGPAEPPLQVEFAPPRPSPSRGPMTLAFGLPRAGHVRLAVYGIDGRLVAVPIDGWQPAGRQVVAWDAQSARGGALRSGVYWFRLETPEATIVRRSVLIR